MKLLRGAGAMVAVAISVRLSVPILVEAVHALLLPTVVGVVLYLLVRAVNARLDR